MLRLVSGYAFERHRPHPRNIDRRACFLRRRLAGEYDAVPAKTLAAVAELLPALRRRLLELCDLNGVVREMKAAQSSEATAALWERAKVTSAY
jgi:hypothetical protein